MFSDDYKGQRDSGVLGMIENIKTETAAEEDMAHKDEEESQRLFNEAISDLQKEEKALGKSIRGLESNIAKAKQELSDAELDLKTTQAALDKVVAYLAQIKPGCDFIDDNLQLRKDSRKAEKSALQNAHDLLKGTPAYKAAVAREEQLALGTCKNVCNDMGKAHVECKACLAEVTVPGYCAGHPKTDGC